ncbi:hypothetical protein CONPUDRAFT_71007 [Coniophora puteana RWD-64-598 SS2]|uniref:Uncharacterized protein n=1 Tax=Coniophora puteana (strain RWD-64-598) TaxID=741705 RepID=A0A5M3MYE4_CONPW|nr:uncharacterized protein CONPUDRAFT_71007 [Coniophora puteana RWD-64-598 SS2]EIW84168.1 hypothetical protein CONPUDRAFT_71007 [Coniophora puteana RWD-64-598 SS2]
MVQFLQVVDFVGWLPIVKDNHKQKKKKAWSNFKNAVWHESFKKFLEEVAIYAKTGQWVNRWDGIEQWFFPTILILSADFKSVMALTRGVNAKRPCPQTAALLEHARTLHHKEWDKVLLQAGMRNIDDVFSTLERTDVYKALSFDIIHANKEGMFGYHLWPIVQKEVLTLGCDVAAAVDDNKKHGDISKALTFTCHSILQYHVETGPNGYLLLRLVRAYVKFDMWLTLDVHTDITLAAGQKSLDILADLTKLYVWETATKLDKDWNFPENHTCNHSFRDIIVKGVT